MKKTFSKNIFGLLANSGFHNMIVIYMNTFLVAYLLNVSSGNFFNVALYYVISYLVMIVAYTLFSFLVCKVNKIILVRMGIFMQCVILAVMAFSQSQIVDYLIPIAIIYNTSNALYWSGLNALSNEVVKGKMLQNYNTYSSVISGITSIVIPVIFGRIIDNSSLFVIATLATIIGILQMISTLFIDKPNITHKKLDFKGYFRECYNTGHKSCYKLLFFGYITYGCKDAISVLITMLIVLTFQTNTSLGAINSIISCLTIITLIITNKKYHSKNANLFLYIGGITVISMLLLIININKPAIIFFNICYSSLLAILNRSFAIKRSGLIRAVDKKQYIVEHQAITELFLNIGRVTFYSILLIASFTTQLWVYQSLVAIGMSFICLYGVFSYLLEKEYNKILIEREFKKQQNKTIESPELIPCYSNPNNETILR